MAGDNENYVQSKSELFVSRCHGFDRRDDGSDITQTAVQEIAFAALDTACSLQLYAVLDASIREQ